MKYTLTWLAVALSVLVTTASTAQAQSVIRAFDGDTGPELAACAAGAPNCNRPPEMDVAANGRQVVQVTWQNVLVFDYAGHLLKKIPMTDFVRNAGMDPVTSAKGPPIEPHVVFDEFIGRWIVAVTCSADCLLVSAGDDATGAWGGATPSCQEGGPCTDRDPALHIGFDKNGVYECAGRLGEANPRTIIEVAYDCFAISSAAAKGIGQGIKLRSVNRGSAMPHEIFPAVDHTPTKRAEAPNFFLAKTCDRSVRGGCQNAKNYAFRWIVDSVTWQGATAVYNRGGDEQEIKTARGGAGDLWLYNRPCCGDVLSVAQPGSDKVMLRVAESHRLTNLIQAGSHIYGVMASGPCAADCGVQGVDKNNLFFFVDLDCSKPAACNVSDTAKLASADMHVQFGSVGVDRHGNIAITANALSPGMNLSIVQWTRRARDPRGAFRGPTVLTQGTTPYTCTNPNNLQVIANAGGVDTALDPADSTKLWVSQQWANDATPCAWTTRILQYQIAPARR